MEQMTLLDLFFMGKWAMWPLLVFSIATISLIAERMIFIFSHNLSVKDIKENVLTSIKNKDYNRAAEYLKKSSKRRN